MTKDSKRHCLRVLQHPEDKAAFRRLVRAVEAESRAKARQLRDLMESEARTPKPVEWQQEWVIRVVVRVVPKPVAVRFGCECARRVLPLFERARPAELRPRELVDLAESQAERRGTKKGMIDKFKPVQEIVERIEGDWDTAFANGDFDSLTRRQRDQTTLPSFAIDVVMAAGIAAVADRAPVVWYNVDVAVDKCIQAESIRGNSQRSGATVRWMIRRLEALVGEIDP